MKTLWWLVCVLQLAVAYKTPHYQGERSTLVHLFEWTWPAIATECEQFLGPQGFGGVQISPPNENRIVLARPWWERYQPISYLLTTRSGTEPQLRDMITRCNRVGVRIYVDAVLNHMSGGGSNQQTGTGGSVAYYEQQQYPAVPYGSGDFHASCDIVNYEQASQVRNCRLVTLIDLNQTQPYVRQTLVSYMNKLIDMGVAGFRIDAAKHMWPADLKFIYENLHDLNVKHGFEARARPYIFQEVIDLGGEGIKSSEYTALGCVTEFRHSKELGRLFRRENALKWLRNWGPEWSLLPAKDALVFVDNHDNQRGHGAGGNEVLTYKDADAYKMALLFMLAHPYGNARIMSSFAFNSSDQGPPSSADGHITPARFLPNGQCDPATGWICEHRWPLVAHMVQLRNVAGDAPLVHWWSQYDYQIAFGRAGRVFVAINMEAQHELNAKLKTGLPEGTYCDVVSGSKTTARSCNGRNLHVDAEGWLQLQLPRGSNAIAIHIGAKI